MKKILCFFIMAAVLMMSFGTITVFSASGKNAIGNEANGGYAVPDGQYVYYSADKKLYRTDTGGGNKKVLVDGNSSSSLVVYGDWIYYSSGSVVSADIYKVKKDGSNNTNLHVGCSLDANLIVQNGYLYYKTDSSIMKMNISDETKKTKLASTYDSFAIMQNRIYFDNADSGVGFKGLASIDLNGNSFKSYGVGDISYVIGAYKNKLYFSDDYEIKRMSGSGNIETLGKCNSSWFNIYDNYIYFSDSKNDSKLSRIPANGGETEVSSLKLGSDMCIVEGYVYRRSPDNYNNVTIKKLPSFKSSGNSEKEHNTTSNTNNSNADKSDISDKYINISDWAYSEIKDADSKRLIPSYFEGKDLTKEITRDEFAAIAVQLYEKLSGKTASSKTTPFKDISGSSLKKEIGKAYYLNVAIGVSKTEFEPNVGINREQLATMLCRVIKKYKFPEWNISVDADYHMSGANSKKFADDSDISDFAKDSVYFMNSAGIIKGIGNNKFAPKNTTSKEEAMGYANATREQAIIMSDRIFNNKNIY